MFGPVDARDFNTSFISTEHLKQKYFLNVVQLLSFNLMLLIFLKLTILLFFIAFFGCRCGVVICVCFCVCCKNIYLHLFKTQNSCAITFYVFHLFWAQSSEQIYSRSRFHKPRGLLLCRFSFCVWSLKQDCPTRFSSSQITEKGTKTFTYRVSVTD